MSDSGGGRFFRPGGRFGAGRSGDGSGNGTGNGNGSGNGNGNGDGDSGQKGDTSPCPNGNGTTIGTSQSFTLQCGLNIGGDVISEIPTTSFIGCVDSCASTHPRCDGVSFNGRTCRHRAGANVGQASRPSGNFDSALAIFPTGLNSQCGTLGSSATSSPAAGSKRFDISCGRVLDGGDMLQQHTATFFDCIELCSRSSACAAVSYDWQMSNGFNNCYLKGSATELVTVADIDTAILNRGPSTGSGLAEQPANPAPSPSASPPASVSGSGGQGVVAVPVPGSSASGSPAPQPTGGGVVFMPPAPPAPPPSSVTTTEIVLRTTTAPGASSATLVTSTRVTVLEPQAPSAAVPDSASTGGPSSQAWIAAPVVGSVAAVMVIAVVFAMWGRRRGKSFAGFAAWIRGWLPRSKSDGSEIGRSLSSRDGRPGGEKGAGGFWRRGKGEPDSDGQWLRDAERGAAGMGRRGSSITGSSARSIRSARSSISRDGPTAGPRPASEIPGVPDQAHTPRYEVKGGRVALRDSMNGLSQNKPEMAGIPGFLRESRIERPS